MFQPEELALLAGLGNENGVVENRKLKTDEGWIRLFKALVSDGYLVPISENMPEKGQGDYLISTYKLTPKGRGVALGLTRRHPVEDD